MKILLHGTGQACGWKRPQGKVGEILDWNSDAFIDKVYVSVHQVRMDLSHYVGMKRGNLTAEQTPSRGAVPLKLLFD